MKPRDATTAYARAVVAGSIITGRWVRLAAERHLRDLRDGAKRGLHFDIKRAAHACEFFPRFLRLAEGAHAGQPFRLEPWQAFNVGSLFGWLDADGDRRFRTAYIEVGKGNGKTPMAAGIGLYGLMADGEASAEIYAAAVTREQAGILFADARKMALSSPALASRLKIDEHNIAHPDSWSFFRPVSSEARSLDGKRVHMALIDEVFEHPNPLVIDKMRAGTKGRRQALIIEITNAGFDRHSVCWEHHEHSTRVLEGTVENDAWFAFVAGLDPCEKCRIAGRTQPSCDACDQWTDERTWKKANPNLGVSVMLKYLREQVKEALEIPSKQNLVRRLSFCEWTESATRWLDADRWRACGTTVDAAALVGRPCYAGLDLSSTKDLTALVLLFPDDFGGYDVLPFFWVPGENLRRRRERDNVPYDDWARAGLIETTEGDVVDYDRIHERLRELATRYAIQEIAYDRWNATHLITQLQGDGATVVPIGQGFASLSAPSRELEKLVLARALRYGGHPVLSWCALNCVVETDSAGNIKPSKRLSTERIDGAVALVMALARAMLQRGAGTWNPDDTILGPSRATAEYHGK